MTAFVACAIADADSATLPTNVVHYIQCVQKDADFVLEISVKFPGQNAGRLEKVYLQQTKPEEEGAYRSISSLVSGCGPDGGVVTSVTPEIRENDVELTIQKHVRSAGACSSIELKIDAPYFVDRKGEIDGITYEIAWTKIQRLPNKTVQTTTTAVAPAAAQPARQP